MAKETSVKRSNAYRHAPLGRQKKQVEATKNDDSGSEKEGGDEFLDVKTSRKILQLAKKQQEELVTKSSKQSTFVKANESNIENNDNTSFSEDEGLFEGDDDEYLEEFDHFAQEYEIDEKDQELIDKFMAPEPKKQMLLSDMIMQKMMERDQAMAQEDAALMEDNEESKPSKSTFSAKIMDVYTKVGFILSRYRSGKVPKMFKVIPCLADWEDVLLVTNPETWTPQATYQATRIFVSNLKDKQVQRFFSVFLLAKVRDDIQQNKKLNYHYYMALKKSLYKPGAFFKGILLPMCESGSCTLQEAVIVGSVISKVSIPVLHSAAALLKLAEMDYSGPNSLFIRIFLDKKYALPYKVIDSLVFHFIRFRTDRRELPLLWHQSLLVFVQRYKNDIAPDQRDALLDLCKDKYHPMVTEEIRRELASIDNIHMVVMN